LNLNEDLKTGKTSPNDGSTASTSEEIGGQPSSSQNQMMTNHEKLVINSNDNAATLSIGKLKE